MGVNRIELNRDGCRRRNGPGRSGRSSKTGHPFPSWRSSASLSDLSGDRITSARPPRSATVVTNGQRSVNSAISSDATAKCNNQYPISLGKVFPKIKRKGVANETNGNDADDVATESSDYVFRIISKPLQEESGNQFVLTVQPWAILSKLTVSLAVTLAQLDNAASVQDISAWPSKY